jgi:hypothetical protein
MRKIPLALRKMRGAKTACHKLPDFLLSFAPPFAHRHQRLIETPLDLPPPAVIVGVEHVFFAALALFSTLTLWGRIRPVK